MSTFWHGTAPSWLPSGYQIPIQMYADQQQWVTQARNTYSQFDKDSNGVLKKKEFKMAMQAMGAHKAETKHLFKMVDKDHNKKSTLDEFINAFLFVQSGGMRYKETGYSGQHGSLGTTTTETNVYPNVDYRIRSVRNGHVLDDWGGKVGEDSAAYQIDDTPSSGNRAFRLILVDERPGWYRIKSSKGTVLDDWGGKTGENSAAFQNDDAPTSENRIFQIIPVSGHFVIKSTKGTVLDDWNGKTGEDSAAFSIDDNQDYSNTNRLWDFIPHGQP